MSYPISKTTTVVGVRLENELRAIIWDKAKSEGRQPSDLVREVVTREFSHYQRKVDKRQGKLL